jgi:hypothetical protein
VFAAIESSKQNSESNYGDRRRQMRIVPAVFRTQNTPIRASTLY